MATGGRDDLGRHRFGRGCVSRLGNISGRQVMRVAERRGYVLKRVRGDHFLYGRPEGGRNVPIPGVREVHPGLLRDIISQLGMTVDEFLDALRD